MNELTINKEFQKLIPPLTPDEYSQLEKSCIAEGIREAIIIWNGIIVDGHNRYNIATANALNYRTVEKEFETFEDVKEWMIANQLGRRNLSPLQRAYLIGERYKNQKGKHGGNRKEEESSGHFAHLKIAEENNINERSVRRNEKFSDSINEIEAKTNNDVKQSILSGQIKVTKSEVGRIAELPEDQLNKVLTIAKDKTEKGVKYKSLTSIIKEVKKEDNIKKRLEDKKELPENIQLFNGSCIDVLRTLENNSIDCVVTDPPFAIDFNHSWQNTTIKNDDPKTALHLLDQSCSLLVDKCKQDAHLYIFSSFKMIGEFKAIIEKHFDVSNILVWVKNNTSLVDFDKRYAFKYENIFFCKQKGNSERVLTNKQSPDVLEFDRVSNPYHPTEKPVPLLKYLIENSTVEKETVLDCFSGSGATGEACIKTNRNCILIELDKKHYDYGTTRLGE